MVERKTPVPKAAAKEPVGRFYELQQETKDKIPEPYVLTEQITVYPLTRRRNIDLFAAETDEQAGRALLGDAYDAIVALYDDLPVEDWNAFMTEVKTHLFGQAVDEAPGKSEESSSS